MSSTFTTYNQLFPFTLPNTTFSIFLMFYSYICSFSIECSIEGRSWKEEGEQEGLKIVGVLNLCKIIKCNHYERIVKWGSLVNMQYNIICTI